MLPYGESARSRAARPFRVTGSPWETSTRETCRSSSGRSDSRRRSVDVLSGSQITSLGGVVNVTGTGGGAVGVNLSNVGVVVGGGGVAGGSISAGALGTVTVIGQGGGAAGATGGNDGVRVIAGGVITSGNGNVSVTGTSGFVGGGSVNKGVYLAQGDMTHAIRVLEQGLALCRASGSQSGLPDTAADLGYAYALQGRLVEGRALLEEAISESIRTGALLGQAHRVAWLSEVCRLAGRSNEAWQHARQALDLARQHKERAHEARALHQLGTVQAHADPPDVVQAEAHYQQALALADELGMRPLQAHCYLGLGTLYARIDRREQARAELSTAIALYRSMEMTFWLPQAEAALAQVEE